MMVMPTLGRTAAPPVTNVIEPPERMRGAAQRAHAQLPEELAVHEGASARQVLLDELAGRSRAGCRGHEQMIQIADALEQRLHRRRVGHVHALVPE